MAIVLAQMMDRGDMGDGNGGHWWWLIGLVVVAALVVVVVWVVTRSSSPAANGPTAGPRRSAEDTLADRFARGEMDEAEYRRRRDTLRE